MKNITIISELGNIKVHDKENRSELTKLFWQLIESEKEFVISFDDQYSFFMTHYKEKDVWTSRGNSYVFSNDMCVYEREDVWKILLGHMTMSTEVLDEIKKISIAKETLYSLYKADWMRRISSERIMTAYREWFENADIATLWTSDDNTVEKYIEENGYGGELYVCFDEFCEVELMDRDYVKYLVGNCKPLEEAVNMYYTVYGVPLL